MRAVYVIHNSVTGRNYVGSAFNPRHRVSVHMGALKHNRHKVELMQEDFNKCGEDAFSMQVLDVFEDEEAYRMEIFMMQVLRTKDKKYGYNYKDRNGTHSLAIQDRWRTPTSVWTPHIRDYIQGLYGTVNIYTRQDPFGINKVSHKERLSKCEKYQY